MGITLSKEQLAYAREWAKREGIQDKVRFELVDYRDIKGPFDRIVSVGMFEHVGTRDFPAFFLKCRELLTEEGVALIHTIGRIGGPGSTDAFTRKYIFPGGYIPALSEVVPASEGARLILTDCEILRVHYGTTLRAWYKACVEQQAEIEEIYDAKFFRMWSFYLAGATQAFETGGMVNFQLQFARNRHTLPLTRDYMMVQESVYREQLDRWAKA
jgi:cyclopropane-fatty-acyl-phospholipid synthase